MIAAWRILFHGCLAVAVAALVPGCKDAAGAEQLKRAYALALQERWAEMLPLAKQYACEQPLDPSAHLLLGQAYLNRVPPLYALAVGELELALDLEERSGDVGALRDELDRRSFQLRASQEAAYAQIGWIVHAVEIGVPTAMVVPRLHEAMRVVERGLAVDAEAEMLLRFKERIEFYLEKYGHLDPRLRAAP